MKLDEKKFPALAAVLTEAGKKLYYYCPDDDEAWVEDYEAEYGECDSECPKCGADYTPFDSKADWEAEKKKGKKKGKK